jgi:hypothetical protein
VVAQVVRHQNCLLAAGAAHGIVDLLQAPDGSGEEHEFRPGGAEPAGQRRADPARGAGDHA